MTTTRDNFEVHLHLWNPDLGCWQYEAAFYINARASIAAAALSSHGNVYRITDARGPLLVKYYVNGKVQHTDPTVELTKED